MAVVEKEVDELQILILSFSKQYGNTNNFNLIQSFQNTGKKGSSHMVGNQNFRTQTLRILERIII